jgi:hypothetical protein
MVNLAPGILLILVVCQVHHGRDLRKLGKRSLVRRRTLYPIPDAVSAKVELPKDGGKTWGQDQPEYASL